MTFLEKRLFGCFLNPFAKAGLPVKPSLLMIVFS